MRTFYLRNSLGQKWNLNDINSFFHTVKGLGQSYDTSYTQIGNRFLSKKNNLAQKKVSGKIRFKGYQEFKDFSGFIQHKPLTLIYGGTQTGAVYPPFYPENREYLLDIVITTLEKGELETGGLQSKLAFESVGTYYRVIHINGDASTVAIDSDTVLESGIRIEIAGPCVNPSYIHYIDGLAVCSGKFLCGIGEGHKLVIDTTKIPYEVKKCTAAGEFVCDLYGTSDFSTKRFVLLGYGRNEIRFTQENAGKLNISVEAKIEYESV